MTSYELTKKIDDLLAHMKTANALLKALDDLSETYDGLIERKPPRKETEIKAARDRALDVLKNILGFKSNLTPNYFLSLFTNKLKRIWSAQLFLDANNLTAYLREFQQHLECGFCFALAKKLEGFAWSYEKFIREHDETVAIDVMVQAKSLRTSLHDVRSVLSFVRQSITGSEPDVEQEGLVSFFLHPDNELSSVITKLKAIQVIYSELCRVLNVSVPEHPLRIVNLESGSLWLRLFGESKVVTLMTDLVRSSLGFMYRHFTKEGMLTSIPMKVEEIESVIALEQRIRDLGVDTTEMRENLRISGVVIAKQLNSFLMGEGVVVINGEVHSIGSTLDKTYLERSKLLLLDGGKSGRQEYDDVGH